MKPLLFLDVDGVINVFDGTPGPDGHLFRDNLVFKGAGYGTRWRSKSVVLDRRHPELLGMLAADFQLVWATAWENSANELLSELLGLEELPVVRFGDRRWDSSKLHWKTRRLAEYASGHPFCWIDDEATKHDASWLHTVNAATLVVLCDPAEGLGERQTLEAMHFAGTQAHLQRPTV